MLASEVIEKLQKHVDGMKRKVKMEEKKYGLIKSVECDNPGAVHIYLGGVDVTTFCSAANDIEGWVDIKKPDSRNILPDAPERKFGNVLIVIDEDKAKKGE